MSVSVSRRGQVRWLSACVNWSAGHGVHRVVMVRDEKVPHAATFTLAREDHTLGNLLRMELLRDPRVRFAGYKHPHPLDNDILVRVQGSITLSPAVALEEAAKRLEAEMRLLLVGATDGIRAATAAAAHGGAGGGGLAGVGAGGGLYGAAR